MDGRNKKIKREENVQGGEQVLVLCDGRDLHSLSYKLVTLATSQSPMGWLKLVAYLNAAWG